MNSKKVMAEMGADLSRFDPGFRVLTTDLELGQGLEAGLFACDGAGAFVFVISLPSGDSQLPSAVLATVAAHDLVQRAGPALARRFEIEFDPEPEPRVVLVARRLSHRTVAWLGHMALTVEAFEFQQLKHAGGSDWLLVPFSGMAPTEFVSEFEDEYELDEAQPAEFEEHDELPDEVAEFDELDEDEPDEDDFDEDDFDELMEEHLAGSGAPPPGDLEGLRHFVERVQRIDRQIELLEKPDGWVARVGQRTLFSVTALEGGWIGRLTGAASVELGTAMGRDEFMERVIERVLEHDERVDDGPEAGPDDVIEHGHGRHPDDLDGDLDDSGAFASGDLRQLPMQQLLTPEELEAFRD